MVSTLTQKVDAVNTTADYKRKLFATAIVLSGISLFLLNQRPSQVNNFSNNDYGASISVADTNNIQVSNINDTNIVTRIKQLKKGTAIQAVAARKDFQQIGKKDLSPLDSLVLPPLEPGMVNVTDNKQGYKIQSGNSDLKIIAIPFSGTEIPNGYTIGDVHTYFYNKTGNHWLQLKKDSVDVSKEIIYSTNTEDGDYINAIIKSPESPETAGFVPTTMNDLKVGDPASMIQLIDPPIQNDQGSATINFHIETPKGRQQVEPSLDITYSSDGSNGILGEGWNLNGISSISVETRWGVPRYTSNEETETYLLDGKMLAMADANDSFIMPHRKMGVPRTNPSTRRFYCRKENNFSKIERIGSLNDYIWVITDKNGTKYYYGGIIAGNTRTVDAVLKNGNKIAEWKLRRVEDLFKNSMEFYYETKETDKDGNTVQSIYPTQILYTFYRNTRDLKNLYKIDFAYDDAARKDFTFSARYGFLSSDNARLLKSINISSANYNTANEIDDSINIRKYTFNYSTGSFSKTILDSISQWGYSGDEPVPFYSQKFDYYSLDSLKGNYFTDAQINIPADDFLGKSDTKAKLGFGGAVGIGLPDFQFLSKSLSFDAQFSYKENESESTVSFVDINGDSKPDIVTKRKDGRIFYRPNTSDFNQVSFGSEFPINGISGFGKDDGSSQGFGAEVNGPTQSRIYAGVDRNNTNSYSKIYFTDANGDGLMDVAENGGVKFNTFNGRTGAIAFSDISRNTPNPISSGSSIGSDLITEDRGRIDEEQKNNIMISPLHDVVRVWIAPDSGTIRIEAPVNLIQPVLGTDKADSAAYDKADGVYVSVQQNSAYIFNPLPIQRGDTSVKSISLPAINVNGGDMILFRVQSGNTSTANGDYDQVRWNPTITYLSKDTNKHFINPFNKNQFEFNAVKDHLYDNEVFNLPDSGKYTISGRFIKPHTKDSVTLRIRLSGSFASDSTRDSLIVKRLGTEGGDTTLRFMKYIYTIRDSVFEKTFDTSRQVFATNFPVAQKYSYNSTLSFEIIPFSNFDLTGIEWKPKIVYEHYDSTAIKPADRLKKDSVLYFPKKIFKGQLLKRGMFITVRDSGIVKISPVIALDTEKNIEVNIVVSDKDRVILRKRIDQSTFLKDTISFVRDKNELFSVHYEIGRFDHDNIQPPPQGQIPAFLLIPPDYENWVVPSPGQYSFFSTKKGALARSVIRVNGADSLPHNRDTLGNFLLKENDVISFIDTVTKKPVPFSTILTQAAAVFTVWDGDDYGNLYRGWGQGVFNGSDYLQRPIDVSHFKLSQVKRANLYQTEFFSMPHDIKTLRNTGINKRIYINKDTISSSRMAMANVIPEPLFNVSSHIEGSAARAVVKYSKSSSTSIAGGGGGFTINTSNDGNTVSYSDYLDLNGDRYPDIAGQSFIQYTTPLGGLRSESKNINTGTGIQNTSAKSSGINLGGVFFHPFLASGKAAEQKINTVSTSSSKIAAALAGLSGGYNTNRDEVNSNLYDINGDGLLDKVTSRGNVFINTGDGFSEQPINWGFDTIQSNFSKTISLGGGYNSDNNSVSGGVNIAQTTTEQNSSMIDFNGDGLIDNVILDNKNVLFYLNTGNSIGKSGSQRIDLGSSLNISRSVADSRGISGAYTFSPHIFAILVPVCKIVFSVSANIGDGNNSVKSQWIDINGDGFVDYISYDGAKATIKVSRLSKINRLRKVEGPLGGSFELDYKHIKADFRHPGGKWVLSSVIKNDGRADDGENSKTDFDYEQGYYDRFEREFLGFGKITATDYLDNKPYRKTIAEYNNQNYFVAHQLAKKWTEDANENKYRYEEYAYYEKYRTRASKPNELFPAPANLMNTVVMQNLLKSKTGYNFEGRKDSIRLNQTVYTYDSLLNVSGFEFNEGNSVAERNRSYYKADIAYRKIEKDPYIYGLPVALIVKDRSGKTLKKVKANYPLGTFKYKMQSDTVFFGDKNFATTVYRYDDNCGNLIRKTYADGKKDTFAFDNNFDIYITKITDPYGLDNSFEYDPRFATETKKTLTNGASIKTKYDEFGRVIKVQGPNQTTVDIDASDYTIKIDYKIEAGSSYSVVKHFDENNINDGIYTISFIDGFNKELQTKKTGMVNGTRNWLVSGRQFYDGLYRLIKSYYPTTQAYDVTGDMIIGNAGTTVKPDTDRIPATITAYDIMDRVASTKLPNGKYFENNVYTIKKDGFNNDAQVIVTTYGNDARLNKKEVFTNGSGLVSTEILYGIAGKDSLLKITKYDYDPIHQPDSIYNVHNGNQYLVIANAYDWNGRKVQYYNVSSGISYFEYDKVDNLEKKINAKKDIIDYDYDHKRLIRIKYPKHPEDSVRYLYGEKSNIKSFFSAGKVVFQVDATGSQSFAYDEYGNTTVNTRTIVAPFDTTYTFSSKFDYDSWGRLQQMTYPSGEVVKYLYDLAGNLVKVYGSKYNSELESFPYVNNITYDKFGQRQSIEYGNKLVTNYTYEDTLRRLSALQTMRGGAEIMLSTYKYDELNNIQQNINRSRFPGMSAVTMKHEYAYDNQDQLAMATGEWNGAAVTKYSLNLTYDDQFNIHTRKLDLNSSSITKNVSSNYAYKTGNPLQLDYVKDRITRKGFKEVSTAYHSYDSDGNDTATNIADSFRNNVNERKILWDEENRIRAISNNGYVSSYTYDASGARTIKISNEISGVYINGQFAGDQTNPATYSLYVSPYFSVRNSKGIGTKHIYIGEERIVSQLTNYTTWTNASNEVSTHHPEKDTLMMTLDLAPKDKFIPVGYRKKMYKTEALINSYFDSLEVPHKLIQHNAFKRMWPALSYPVVADPAAQFQTVEVINQVDADEKLRYFYHRNQIGSGSFISDKDQNIVQYIEYMPFGETFMENRKNYSSQFLFNGKEQDQETGLYYYGARYYDPQTYQWLGVDPMAEKYAGLSPYSYSKNNPVRMVDFNGKESSNELACNYAIDQKDVRIELQKEWLYKLDLDDKPIEPSYLIENTIGGIGLAKGVVGLARWGVAKYAARQSAQSLSSLSAEFGTINNGMRFWPAADGERQILNGIEYTSHALERMQPVGTVMKGTEMFSRGVPPSVVENAIKLGKVTPGNTAAEVIRTFENVRVITNPQGTRVISVIKMGH